MSTTASTPLTVYLHPECGTCRKATDWLTANGKPFRTIDIRQQPPSVAELKTMLGHLGKLTKLCNTSGQEFRKLGLSEKLPTLPIDEALALLATNGMLLKRPFLLTPSGGVTGFKEADWQALLG